MGQNSTEVAYGFGQMGSVFVDTTAELIAPYGKAIVAIQCLSDVAFSVLTAETTAIPASGTTHTHQNPEYIGIAVAANNLGDAVIAGASKSAQDNTVTHTANTAGVGGSSAIKVGMQVCTLTTADPDIPRDGINGKPVTIVSITDTTHFEVSDNSYGATLSSQSLAGLELNSSGYGGVVIDTGQVFPKGVTIYGRWTNVKLNAAAATGGIICYFGH